MAYIFDTTDPRGNRVVLEEERWEDHVLYGEHPEMIRKENHVKEAVEDPDFIYKSDLVPSREVYFRCETTAPSRFVAITKVVVENSDPPSKVVTTWRQKAVSGGIGDLVYEKHKV